MLHVLVRFFRLAYIFRLERWHIDAHGSSFFSSINAQPLVTVAICQEPRA
jgi:hypothetical protein